MEVDVVVDVDAQVVAGIDNIIIRIKILNNIIRIIHNTLDLDPIIFPDLSRYIQISGYIRRYPDIRTCPDISGEVCKYYFKNINNV